MYLYAEFADVAICKLEGGFEFIEEGVIECNIFDAEVSAQHFNGELVVLDSLDVLAELLDHHLLDDRTDHPAILILYNLPPSDLRDKKPIINNVTSHKLLDMGQARRGRVLWYHWL